MLDNLVPGGASGEHAKLGLLLQELRESLRPKDYEYYRDWYEHLIAASESSNQEIKDQLAACWERVYARGGDPRITSFEVWLDRMHGYFSERSVRMLSSGERVENCDFAIAISLTRSGSEIVTEATCLLKVMMEVHELNGKIISNFYGRPKILPRLEALRVYKAVQKWGKGSLSEAMRREDIVACTGQKEHADCDLKTFNDYVSSRVRLVVKRLKNVAQGTAPGP